MSRIVEAWEYRSKKYPWMMEIDYSRISFLWVNDGTLGAVTCYTTEAEAGNALLPSAHFEVTWIGR